MKIWLDDIRIPPMQFGWKWARTVNECITFIQEGEELEIISLDHDLGEFRAGGYTEVELTGMDVLWFLAGDKRWPEKLLIHSANPIGKSKMKEFVLTNAPYQQMNVTTSGTIFFWDKI